jgi:transposase
MRGGAVLFIGDDWAEAHHDIEIEDDSGSVLARKRLPEGLAGITALHELIAEHLDPAAEPDQVLIGIETERGPWVQALLAAGYAVFAINPMQVARYRERHSTSGAKSDSADAHLLAEIVRLDRAHHRPVAGDSEIAEHVKIAARAHQTMIWSRVRQVNALRSLLREYYPAALVAFGADLADHDALVVLAAAPSPEQGRRLSQARIEALLRKAGRQRNVAVTAAKIRAALGSEQLTARPGVIPAYAASTSALVAVLTAMVEQTEVLAGQVEQGFGQHPDAEIYRSQPGLGTILGARVLAEFGDDPDRYADAKSRKNYSGMSPITKASSHQAGRAGPLCPEPASWRRIVPTGVQRLANIARCPSLLRPPACPRRHPLPSAPRPRQPARRHPPRLPAKPHPLRRAPRLAQPTRQTQPCSLTASGRGMSSHKLFHPLRKLDHMFV